MEYGADLPKDPSRALYKTKLALRIISILLDLIIIAIAFQAAILGASRPLFFVALPVLTALFWNYADAVALGDSPGDAGLSPRWHVLVETLLWLTLLVIAGFMSPIPPPWDSRIAFSGVSHAVARCTYTLALVVVEILIHIIFFLIACHETDFRRFLCRQTGLGFTAWDLVVKTDSKSPQSTLSDIPMQSMGKGPDSQDDVSQSEIQYPPLIYYNDQCGTIQV